jgi:RHS repeat-associated protein
MLNRVTQIGEDGATSGVGLLASYTYDDHGRRTNIARAGGAGATTAIGYDGSDRISRLAQTFTGAAADVTWTPTYSYNLSPQAVGIGSTNDGYAWHGGVVTRNYVANGLNQYATVGPNAWTYDGRGNLMSNTADSYTYDPQNRLLTASGPTPVTLTYDPIGHLQTTASAGATTTFLYAGDMLVGEYDASGNILRRYVPGPGVDEPVVWYEGAGTSDRRWLHADTSGSVVGYSDSSGNSGATYAYDPYGLPPSWSAGDSRYRYTGQLMIPEANLYYYKARMYDPANGRFPQTDPVGYQSDINLYAYVRNDPINGRDPGGMVSAQCNEDQCQWVDSSGGGYAYDNGNVTITCSQGTFEGGSASSGDCTSSADNDYEIRGGGGDSGSSATGGGSGGCNEATTVKRIDGFGT